METSQSIKSLSENQLIQHLLAFFFCIDSTIPVGNRMTGMGAGLAQHHLLSWKRASTKN